MDTKLRERTIVGVSWSAISQILSQAFTFVISIVLARILGPAVYGLIGLVTVFTGFAAIFGDFALGAAIIQRKQLEERHLNAAFWINVAMGATLTFVMVGLSPVIAWFYGEPELLTLAAVIALKYFIDSLSVVQIALLSRHMLFKKLAWIQIGSTLVSGFTGIGMALNGMGAWSLVAQTLGASLGSLAVAWRLGNWRPHFSFEIRACKDLFGFSAYVLGFDIINYWSRTFDQLLIGRFVGASALGIYSRAYNLMLMPLNQVSRVVGHVMYPALSSIQADKPRVKRAYLKSIVIIGLITFPMMTGLFAVADHFVLALLGVKWAEVIPLFKIFCWLGLMQSITTTVGWLYQSQGRTGLFFIMGVIGSTVTIFAFFLGIRWGIMGVAWAYSAAMMVMWYPSWSIPGRLIGLTFSEIIRSLGPTFICALAMSAGVWSVDMILPVGTSHWQFLAIQIPLGVLLYITLLTVLRLDSWHEGRQIFAEMVLERLKPFKAFLRRCVFCRENGS